MAKSDAKKTLCQFVFDACNGENYICNFEYWSHGCK